MKNSLRRDIQGLEKSTGKELRHWYIVMCACATLTVDVSILESRDTPTSHCVTWYIIPAPSLMYACVRY